MCRSAEAPLLAAAPLLQIGAGRADGLALIDRLTEQPPQGSEDDANRGGTLRSQRLVNANVVLQRFQDLEVKLLEAELDAAFVSKPEVGSQLSDELVPLRLDQRSGLRPFPTLHLLALIEGFQAPIRAPDLLLHLSVVRAVDEQGGNLLEQGEAADGIGGQLALLPRRASTR